MLAALLATVLVLAALPTAAIAEAAEADQFGTLEEYSTYALGEMLTDSYYYTDDWFLAAPEERNDALALASMQLVAAAVEDGADGAGAAFLRSLGFDEVGFNGGFHSDDPDDCAYTWGTKTIQDDEGPCTLVAIVVQSYSFDQSIKVKGWTQNFVVNGDGEGGTSGEHHAFALAADSVIGSIDDLCGAGRVKVWITGQSRGGAIANLIAARLPEELGASNAGVYAYTFESPATVDADAIANPDAYGYIHNYLCSDDIVPQVPLWGMTRYGVSRDLRTEGTEAGLVDELTKLGSAAAEGEHDDVEELVRDLVARLEEQIPTRADYSMVRTDSFSDASGNQVEVTYSNQQTLVNLMGMVFGGDLEGMTSDVIDERMGDLGDSVYALVEAIDLEEAGRQAEAASRYWYAAQGVHSLLDEMAANPVSLSDEGFYALLRLVGPIFVNMSYEPTDDPATDVGGYLAPLIDTAVGADSLTYSHHFDTLIARLKVLAPQPYLNDIDIIIDEPVAGDDAGKAPSQASEFIDSLGNDWLTAEVEWESAGETLTDGDIYYLDVTLRAVGHLVPEDLSLTINGMSPAGALGVTYEEGTSVVRATWEYVIGDPEDVTIAFDASGHGEAPEAITTSTGKTLRNVEAPSPGDTVTEDGVTWRFDGWRDEHGTAWDELVARQDMTVYAAWVQVIDNVEISFPIPEVGGAFVPPSAAEDAPYRVNIDDNFYIVDRHWNDVEEATEEGVYHLHFCVSLKDPDSMEFALNLDEWGFYVYTGRLTLNGVELEANYDDESLYLMVDYNVTIPEGLPMWPTYEFVEGDGQIWTRGSDSPATFTVKRSEDDEETFDLFMGIEVDGVEVDPSSYTAESGSVIVSLKPAYLETLATGRHALMASFDDGSAEASFTVVDAQDESNSNEDDEGSGVTPSNRSQRSGVRPSTNVPETGDGGLASLLPPLLALCASALLMGVLLRRGRT